LNGLPGLIGIDPPYQPAAPDVRNGTPHLACGASVRTADLLTRERHSKSVAGWVPQHQTRERLHCFQVTLLGFRQVPVSPIRYGCENLRMRSPAFGRNGQGQIVSPHSSSRNCSCASGSPLRTHLAREKLKATAVGYRSAEPVGPNTADGMGRQTARVSTSCDAKNNISVPGDARPAYRDPADENASAASLRYYSRAA
jgi:hypothetical protein